MKKLLLVLLVVVLSGCDVAIKTNLKLDDIFEDGLSAKYRFNNYTDYIEYYVPSDVNEEECDKLSYTFSFEDCKFIMNVDISNIINNAYYKNNVFSDEGFFDQDKLIYSKTGQFINNDNRALNYQFYIYQYDDNCLLFFTTPIVNLYGYCNRDKVELLSSKMVEIGVNCKVYSDKIIADYSSKDVIDYEKTIDNLFGSYFPVEGRIDDLMVDQVSND